MLLNEVQKQQRTIGTLRAQVVAADEQTRARDEQVRTLTEQMAALTRAVAALSDRKQSRGWRRRIRVLALRRPLGTGLPLPPGVPDTGNDEPQSARVALEQFVYDNVELERLESILDTFNPFVAMRWIRQEIRHSAFLRWLFDPSETHGLGDYFLDLFLKRVARRSPAGGPSVVDIDSWDLSRAVVHQEGHGVDVLVQDDRTDLWPPSRTRATARFHSQSRLGLDPERPDALV